MPASICLIVNPSAGGGKSARLAPAVMAELERLGLQARRLDTRDIGHARELGRAAALAGETVVALSGDGLIGVLADELRALPGAVMGLLPGGRGNDLARVLGISDDAVQACATIATGVVRELDLGLVTEQGSDRPGRAFVGIASVGFDSDANRIANDAPAWLGGFVYTYGALRALLAWRPARFQVELDPPGERIEITGYSIGTGNSRAYGGGMYAAPAAMLDDGLLEVIGMEHVGKLRFLGEVLPRVFKGTHVELPYVRSHRAAEVLISCDRPFQMYADGEEIGTLPVRVRALRGALRVLVPAGGSDALRERSGAATA
ncbi:MAG: diacylglycerol/lipid kinase family protein [Solirubrobacteraceae bacterium]